MSRYDARVAALKAQLAAADACTDETQRSEKRAKAEKQLGDLQEDMEKVQLKQMELEKKEKVKSTF